MTITLTREEAQQVLGAMEKISMGGHPDWANDVTPILRARLSAPECVCGEPNTAGVHRQDGPCYQQTEPDAIQYDKDGNEMAHWKFRSFAPPQREWQGLTDEEMWSVQSKVWGRGHEIFWFEDPNVDQYTRAIEAKLKEKNAS
jgi:hypothetical protein